VNKYFPNLKFPSYNFPEPECALVEEAAGTPAFVVDGWVVVGLGADVVSPEVVTAALRVLGREDPLEDDGEEPLPRHSSATDDRLEATVALSDCSHEMQAETSCEPAC
jgi:hypothetical protein